MTIIITTQMLTKLNACHSKKMKFHIDFGGILILRNVDHAIEVAKANPHLDYGWASRNFFSHRKYRKYIKICSDASIVYRKSEQIANREYAIKDYHKYSKCKNTAWLEYKEAEAIAFAKVLFMKKGFFVRLFRK